MENKVTKQPEIKDGKLIIDNTEINLEGLQELVFCDKPKNQGIELQELFTSISIIGALVGDSEPDKVNGDLIRLNLPSYNSLYGLKVVIEALKKM